MFYHPAHERRQRKSNRTNQAKTICATCPVITECVQWALETREPYEVWGGLLDAGMNVARMYFSHGDYDDPEVIDHRLRDAAKASGQALAIMADRQGRLDQPDPRASLSHQD